MSELVADNGSGKISCCLCGAQVHVMQQHLKTEHVEMTVEDYRAAYPDAPMMSDKAKEALARKLTGSAAAPIAGSQDAYTDQFKTSKAHLHEVFGLGAVKAALGHTGKPIPISVVEPPSDLAVYVPDQDPRYVWNIDLLKTVLMAFEMNKPFYLWGHAGVGKCLGRGTPVLMFNGSIKPVEEVRKGDLVMGPDSFPRLVTSTTTGREMLYRVTPVKGDPYVVNESHILSLRMTGGSENNCGLKSGSIINIEVRDYLKKSAAFKQSAKGWRTGVDFLPQVDPLRMEPYFLGLWLGDGTAANSQVWTIEQEIRDYLNEYAQRLGHGLYVREDQKNANSGLASYSIAKPGGAKWAHPLREALSIYGLLNNKHIPHVYKTASRQERLELLAGLIDTDGYLVHGCYSVTLKSERLLDDVLFVARSLGFAAYKTEVEKSCTYKGEKVTGTYYTCHISGDVDVIPCKVQRKIAEPRQQKKNVLNVGITVEAIGEDDYYGFQLAGPDRLFLLGDFTVTHNTTVIEQICASTKRPWIRVQHTRNTEEAHVIGQYVVKDGATVFELGPLAYAMKYGLTYVADEYDFAMPAITALYQPVLEGKPLVIKEAPVESRVIRPHPLFRFAATGNTNGTGDETGLYQGTTIQNAANYERFAIVEEVRYPEKQIEVNLVSGQGGIPLSEAEKMVGFGALIREAFTNGKIGLPVSPRALINAAQIGKARGSLSVGLQLAYINRLSRVDQEVARETLNRIRL